MLANCRGFGFVTFKSSESVGKVLKAHQKEPISIDEKMVSGRSNGHREWVKGGGVSHSNKFSHCQSFLSQKQASVSKCL